MSKVSKKAKKWQAGHKIGKSGEKLVQPAKGKKKKEIDLKKSSVTKPKKSTTHKTKKTLGTKRKSTEDSVDGSETPANKKSFKPRVSFAEQLNHRWEPKPGEKVNPEVVTPVSTNRSILKTKNNDENDGSSSPTLRTSNKNNNIINNAVVTPLPTKKKVKLQITKKQKEDLKTMTRQQKKIFLRELKEKRKPYSEIAAKAKKIWEKVRNKKTASDVRDECIAQLCDLVKGHLPQLIFAHDSVRVVQYLMSLKRADIREQLFGELSPHIIPMAKSKYAKFFVVKMLKYGTRQQRNEIMDVMRGNVVDLFCNSYAADAVQFAYNEYADKDQRSWIVAEFYGKQYSLFKDKKLVSLANMPPQDPSRAFIIRNLKEIIIGISFKPTLQLSLAHRLLCELVTSCDEETMCCVVDAVKERLCEVVHSKDGAVAACHVIWSADTKERKLIVKSMKGLVVKIAKEEYGHWVLLALFDTIDDTVLLKKSILTELSENLGTIAENQFGLKVLQYIIRPRHQTHFNKEIREILEKGDTNKHSKKDRDVRHKELLDCVSPSLIEFVGEQMDELLKAANTSLLVLSTLIYAPGGSKQLCYEAIAEVASVEFEACPMEGEYHLVERKHGSFVLKHLLAYDKVLEKEGKVTLSQTLANKISVDKLASWTACNKGAFVLLGMFESGDVKVQEVVKKASEVAIRRLHTYSHQGAILLRKKVLLEK